MAAAAGRTPDAWVKPRDRPEQYKTLLRAIAISLGLSESESNQIISDACMLADNTYDIEKDDVPLKIWLTKIVVHRCIFKISNQIFSHQEKIVKSVWSVHANLISFRVPQIPLTFKTIYILMHGLGFTETDAAHILNINQLEVRERLRKAMKRVK
jgi:hypothetical protein